MNVNEGPCVTTSLLDAGQRIDEAQTEEEGHQTDLGQLIGMKVCKKAGLKQLLISFNIGTALVRAFENDFKLMFQTEKVLTELIKQQQQ